MNVETMTMTRDQATRALRQYRERSRTKQSAEFDEIETAYAKLAKGTPLLDVSMAIANAKRDEKLRPLLAIGRADRRQIEYQTDQWHNRETFAVVDRARSTATLAVSVPSSAASSPSYVCGYSLIPIVPPNIADGRDLSQYFVFWEVEKWADRQISARADRDPYLLQRISPTLFAVIAEWDLTDVERAVMNAHRVTL